MTAIPDLSLKIDKYITENGMDKFNSEMERITTSYSNLTDSVKCAEHHGVSVDVLINSPNLEKLKDEYLRFRFTTLFSDMAKSFGFEDRECWALWMFNKLGLK